ncbi:hypothetical protein LCGC14_1282530, partial [marine sediment metagenome]
MKCLVTGGAGFIGSHVVERLLTEGHEVTILDNLSTGTHKNLEGLVDNKKCWFHNINIAGRGALEPSFRGIDWVFHLAGKADIVPSIQNPEEYFNTNTLGTMRVMEACRKAEVKKVIYAASSSCYGDPPETPTDEGGEINLIHPYALTKYLGEEVVLHWGLLYKIPVMSLRLFNVYGPRSRTSGAYGAVFG